MATTFAAVNDVSRNASLNPADSQRAVDDHTPTTPKPTFAEPPQPPPPTSESRDVSNPTTPTRHTFAGAAALPPETPGSKRSALDRQDSHGAHDPSDDIEMGDAEKDDGQADGEDGSDNESVTSDSKRPSKKKKGQRFFCTDFPPCQLSFTRSEHLARHIRKHTGERPFQCHCNRRFSRLDNLRQHAQTVHVNEEIPGDSLAATSTRFQRQIRTDRVRPPSSRSRASTLGSQGGHSRGHSRNLSTSSIGSTASSIMGFDDGRRRPQPLAMANDPTARARLSLNTYENPHAGLGQPYPYYNQSPTGYSTPTSTTFSTGPGSPQLTSPSASLSRSSYYNGARHARRLSVPSGPPPFQGPGNASYPAPYYTPIPSATSSTFSQSGSMFGSPTSSVFSHSRRESDADLEFRRRTWHPSTYSNYSQRPATSGLSYHQTPDDQRPERIQQPAASQVTRLPGIESFDHAPPSNTRPPSSPMMLDARPSSSGRPSTDHGLHHGLTRLDLTAANAPLPPPTGHGPQQPHHQHSASMPEQPVTPRQTKRQGWYGGPIGPPATYPPAYTPQRPSPEDSGSSDGVPTPSTSQGVEYTPVIVNAGNGAVESYPPPTTMHSAVPEDPQLQKSTYYVQHPPSQPVQHGALPPPPGPAQPTYVLQAGHDPRYPPHQYAYPPHSGPPQPGYAQYPSYPPPPQSQAIPMPATKPDHDMGRLEALVAVATSEGRAAAAMEKGSA